MAFEAIENYGVIGNIQSIALVGMNGSIDFLCYPDFDSPTVFAALLDDEKGGRFRNSAAAVQHARAATLPNSTEHVA
jgi:GH15 family glucan-1,4-alpha-glucosidase